MNLLDWLMGLFKPKPVPPLFVGDYSTGNFDQWLRIQNKLANDDPYILGWPSTGEYPAQIIDGAARYEVRNGDVMAQDGRERSEVHTKTWEREGDTRWYKFSTMFDRSFPTTWAEGDWGIQNQWHAENESGVQPPVCFGYGFGVPIGRWGLI